MSPATPPPVEIFDVTIRDGSYVIDFQFRQEDVSFLYETLDRLGFRYIEVGHGFGLNASSMKGAAAASDEQYLEAAAAKCANSRFGAFFIPGIGQMEDLKRAREHFGMHFIRIGQDPEKIEQALPYIEYARGLGYEVMANFMKTYAAPPGEVGRKSRKLADAGAEVVYVVDSAGGMLPDEVTEYVRAIADNCPAKIGFHGHNNLELAIANAVSAWRAGCSLIDCSIGGLGRSAGNTRTELLIPVLKALGQAVPYDYQEVLRVWQDVVRPLMARRPTTPLEVVGGYARVHSGLMGPFLEAARKYGLNPELILDAWGDRHYNGVAPGAVDELARELVSKKVAPTSAAGSDSRSLLHIGSPFDDRTSIRNTFHSVEEVLRAVNTLSHKAVLPVAALVSITNAPEEDARVLAEYLYHDEHFIVLRASFPSIASFRRVLDQYRGWFDVLVFEDVSDATRTELIQQEPDWRQQERVLWADQRAVRFQHLASVLHHVAAERGAKKLLLVGGVSDRLAAVLATRLADCELWCTSTSEAALHHVGLRLVHRPVGHAAEAPGRFGVAVLLTGVSPGEIEAVLARLEPGGAVIDCLNQGAMLGELAQGRNLHVLTLHLRECLTGELMNLIRAGVGSPARRATQAAVPVRNVA
jgi:4-hydroxy-2-oxovalerate aldolase